MNGSTKTMLIVIRLNCFKKEVVIVHEFKLMKNLS